MPSRIKKRKTPEEPSNTPERTKSKSDYDRFHMFIGRIFKDERKKLGESYKDFKLADEAKDMLSDVVQYLIDTGVANGMEVMQNDPLEPCTLKQKHVQVGLGMITPAGVFELANEHAIKSVNKFNSH